MIIIIFATVFETNTNLYIAERGKGLRAFIPFFVAVKIMGIVHMMAFRTVDGNKGKENPFIE